MENRFPLGILAFILALLFPSGASFAGEIPSPVRPLTGHELISVVGTRTLGTGGFSVGGDLEITESPDITRVSFLVAYGITDDLEIGGALPYTGAEDHEAVGDVMIGAKYRVFHEGRYGPALGVAAGLNLPTGQHQEDAVSGRMDAQMMLLGTKRLGPFTGHINVGYTLVGQTGYDDEVTAAAGLEFAAARTITFLGELYSRSSRVPNQEDLLEWRVGYKVNTPGGIVTKLGLGFPFGGRAPDYRIIFGLSWNPGFE